MKILLSIFSLLPALILFIPLLSNNILLGGEGLFTINYSAFFNKFFSFWFTDGFGHPNVLFNFIGVPHIIFLILEKLNFSYKVINSIYVFILFLLPFISFFLLSYQLTKKKITSLVVSSLYCFNTLSISYLASLNITNSSSLSTLPLLLFIYVKYYNSKYLYLLFGFFTLLFSYSFYNPPTFIAIFFSIILFIPFNFYLINKKMIFIDIFKDITKLTFIIFLFNIWWIFPTILSLNEASALMSSDFAISWEASTHKYKNQLLLNILFLDHFKYLSSISIFNNFLLIKFFYLFFLFFLIKNLNYKSIKFIYLIFMILLSIFFMKGTMPPFGIIYDALLKYIPFFWVMKSPIEKFSIPFIFYFSLLILFFINERKEHILNNKILLLFICIFISLPYIIFKDNLFLNSFNQKDITFNSKRYLSLNNSHISMIDFINSREINGRILILPQNLNYQSMIKLDEKNNVFTGLSFISESTNATFLRLDHQIYKGFSKNVFESDNILDQTFFNMFAIEYVLVNMDTVNWFGFVDYINLEGLNNFQEVYSAGNLTLFKVNKSNSRISIPNGHVINLNNVK